MNWDKKFLKGLFREEDGTPSSSRVNTLLIVLASLAWVSFVVFKTHAIPDLTTVSAFDTVSIGSLYGLNKLTSLGKQFAPGANPPTP